VFEAIPSQLHLHDNRFVLSDLEPTARYRNYESAFFWLSDSRIVNIAYNTFAPTIGLNMNTERCTLRCYMADTGLLISLAFSERGQMPAEVYERLLHDKLEVNLGMVMENVVAQMLAAAGNRLFFYNHVDRDDASNDMEIDFLITKSHVTSRKNISPIEVKSSTHFTTTSLNKCMSKFSQAIGEAFVLHTNDIRIEENICYLPLYMAGLL
jgi:predicted AAA+ superfamily ATPase